jgi:hypothetical protein
VTKSLAVGGSHSFYDHFRDKEGKVSDALTEDPVLTLGLGLMNEFVEIFAFESFGKLLQKGHFVPPNRIRQCCEHLSLQPIVHQDALEDKRGGGSDL